MPGGGSKQQTAQTTQSNEPWGPQQPYLTQLFSEAQKLYQGNQPQYFQGNAVAPPAQGTLDAQNYLMGLAQNQMPQYAQQVGQASTQALNAPNLQNNPYIQPAIDAAINPAVRAFQTAMMPTIRNDFGGGENYGGSRRAVATGLASDALARNIFNTSATMASTAYGQGLDAQSRALALTPQTMQAMQQPGLLMDTVGQQQQGYQQDLINAEMAKWNFNQQAPWQSLAQYQQMVTGNYGGQGTATQTTPTATPNRALSAMGGAAAGFAVGGPVGAVAGLVLGGLFGG